MASRLPGLAGSCIRQTVSPAQENTMQYPTRRYGQTKVAVESGFIAAAGGAIILAAFFVLFG